MRILIHSNGPMVPSGYGQQTRLLLGQLQSLDHEVAVSAFHGLSGSPLMWEGCPIFPAGQAPYGTDVLLPHAEAWDADLIITLMDFWKLLPIARELAQPRKAKLAAWLPVDCSPLGVGDRAALAATRALPIAMTRWGLRQLQNAGHTDALYVPHAVDVLEYHPVDREALRDELGLVDNFVVGICAANNDAVRKAWPEQMRAFARFRDRVPHAVLLVHSVADSSAGLDLRQLAADMGIAEAVIFSDRYGQLAGGMGVEIMRNWYACLDVLLSCSYAEGFGVPVIEAQACGVPVIVTDGTAPVELLAPCLRPGNWAARSVEFWNYVHRAWWRRPDVEGIVKCLTYAYRAPAAARATRGRLVVDHAATYDVRTVANGWQAALKTIGDM